MTGASRFAPTGSRDCSAQCFWRWNPNFYGQLPKKVPIHPNVFLVTSQCSFIQKKETDSSTLRSLIALCDTDIFALWVTLVPWLTWCSAMLPFKRETFSQNMPVINGAFLSHGGTPNSPWKPREPSSWGRALPWQSSPRGPARLARRPSRWASVGHGSRGFLE